jgi:hypothetical protein
MHMLKLTDENGITVYVNRSSITAIMRLEQGQEIFDEGHETHTRVYLDRHIFNVKDAPEAIIAACGGAIFTVDD